MQHGRRGPDGRSCGWGPARAALGALAAVRVRAFAAISLALTAAAVVATIVGVQAPLRPPAEFADAAAGVATLEFDVTGAEVDGRVPVRAELVEHPEAGTASVLIFLDEPV